MGDVRLTPASLTASTGSDFALEIRVDSGTSKVGAYTFELTFDPARLQVNDLLGDQGVQPGVAALGTNIVNLDNFAGTLNLTGFDVSGAGPGTSLHLLTINFTAQGVEGDTPIGLVVSSLTNELGAIIGTPNGQGSTITVSSGNALQVAVEWSSYPGTDGTSAPRVYSTDGYVDCPSDCEETYQNDEMVTLVAERHRSGDTPNNLAFDHWEGDCANAGTNLQCTVSMTAARNARAIFSVQVGDTTCDGIVTIVDALLTARRSSGLSMDGTAWCSLR
jgi:hypothetical protein